MSRDDDPSVPRGRLRRLMRVAGLAGQVGAGLATDRVKRLLGVEGRGPEEAAQRVLETLGQLKGVALKAGQAAALFADLLSPEARARLGRLFSQAPALSLARIAAVVEAELGAPPAALFAHFSEAPLAAASLGQVHAARLHTGEAVVVKVQYPGVAQALEDDLGNVAALLRTLGVGGALLDVREYVEELERELSAELDYRRELALLERFRGYLARWPDLVVPRTFPELSSARVLVLEHLPGPTLHALLEDAAALPAHERWRRSEQLLRAVWGPWFGHRTVHADTHPGNYVAMPDGRLGVLDFGSVKTCSEPFWRATLEALAALFRGEGAMDWTALTRRAGLRWSIPDARAQALFEEVAAILALATRGEWDFATDPTMAQLKQLKVRHALDLVRIKLPAESLLVGRALAGLMQNLRRLGARGDIRPYFLGALREVGVAV